MENLWKSIVNLWKTQYKTVMICVGLSDTGVDRCVNLCYSELAVIMGCYVLLGLGNAKIKDSPNLQR